MVSSISSTEAVNPLKSTTTHTAQPAPTSKQISFNALPPTINLIILPKSNTMPYIYARRLTATENKIRDSGYPWVGTNTFPPHFLLPSHGHHGNNTHLVVQGLMTIRTTNLREGINRLENTLAANSTYYNDTFVVPAKVHYGAIMGSQGCSFVEGHALLSPITAERLEGKGTIRWMGDGTERAEEMQKREWFEKEWRVCGRCSAGATINESSGWLHIKRRGVGREGISLLCPK